MSDEDIKPDISALAALVQEATEKSSAEQQQELNDSNVATGTGESAEASGGDQDGGLSLADLERLTAEVTSELQNVESAQHVPAETHEVDIHALLQQAVSQIDNEEGGVHGHEHAAPEASQAPLHDDIAVDPAIANSPQAQSTGLQASQQSQPQDETHANEIPEDNGAIERAIQELTRAASAPEAPASESYEDQMIDPDLDSLIANQLTAALRSEGTADQRQKEQPLSIAETLAYARNSVRQNREHRKQQSSSQSQQLLSEVETVSDDSIMRALSLARSQLVSSSQGGPEGQPSEPSESAQIDLLNQLQSVLLTQMQRQQDEGEAGHRRFAKARSGGVLTAEERERIREENRNRKKKWRGRNTDRNKDNDLRSRLHRRAQQLFGDEASEKKSEWIENEFRKRKLKRVARQNSGEADGGLDNNLKEDLKDVLENLNLADGNLNTTLQSIIKDPDLLKSLTDVLGDTSSAAAGSAVDIDALERELGVTSADNIDDALTALNDDDDDLIEGRLPELENIASSVVLNHLLNGDTHVDDLAITPPKRPLYIIEKPTKPVPFKMRRMQDDEKGLARAYGFPPLMTRVGAK